MDRSRDRVNVQEGQRSNSEREDRMSGRKRTGEGGLSSPPIKLAM